MVWMPKRWSMFVTRFGDFTRVRNNEMKRVGERERKMKILVTGSNGYIGVKK